MSEDRYYVVEVTGGAIQTSRDVRGVWGTSYSVLDRYYNHEEVWGRYSGAKAPWGRPRSPIKNRQEAYRQCERLNNIARARGD